VLLILDVFWIKQLLDAHTASEEMSLICGGKIFTFGESMAAITLFFLPEAVPLPCCLRDMVVRDKRNNGSKMVDIHTQVHTYTHMHMNTHTDHKAYIVYYTYICI